MRTFSTNVTTLLALDNVEIFTLVHYQSKYFTSLPYDVSINTQGSTRIYSTLGDDSGGLISVEPPSITSSLDKASYKFILSDPHFVFRSAALDGTGDGRLGGPIEIRFGLINTTANVIGNAAPGAPLLDLSDTIVVYAGYVDGQHYSIDFNGSANLTIEGSSPFGDLEATKACYTSKDFAVMRSSGGVLDSAYDEIFDGAVASKMKWGKA